MQVKSMCSAVKKKRKIPNTYFSTAVNTQDKSQGLPLNMFVISGFNSSILIQRMIVIYIKMPSSYFFSSPSSDTVFWIWPYFFVWGFREESSWHTLSSLNSHKHTNSLLTPPTSRQCTWVQLSHVKTHRYMYSKTHTHARAFPTHINGQGHKGAHVCPHTHKIGLSSLQQPLKIVC